MKSFGNHLALALSGVLSLAGASAARAQISDNVVRVGVLATGNDRWWSVAAGAPTQSITTEVLQDVTDYALPWIRARAGLADE